MRILERLVESSNFYRNQAAYDKHKSSLMNRVVQRVCAKLSGTAGREARAVSRLNMFTNNRSIEKFSKVWVSVNRDKRMVERLTPSARSEFLKVVPSAANTVNSAVNTGNLNSAQSNSVSGRKAGSGMPMSTQNNAEIHAINNPYACPAVKVAGRPESLGDAFPTLYAWNNQHLFFVSPDGKIRRFAPDNCTGTSGRLNCYDYIPSGRALERQINYIYDAPVAQIRQTIGEYVLDPEQGTATFMVNGEPVQSVMDDVPLYALPGGKWMIPQRYLRSCTYACELMLLLEGKTREEAIGIVKQFTMHDGRRTFDELANSLTRKTGREVVRLSRESSQSDEDFILSLEAHLKAHGPCVFDAQGGHVRILDKVDRTEHGIFFTLRDPFCGSCLQVDAIAHLQMKEDGTDGGAAAKRQTGEVALFLK